MYLSGLHSVYISLKDMINSEQNWLFSFSMRLEYGLGITLSYITCIKFPHFIYFGKSVGKLFLWWLPENAIYDMDNLF